MGGGGGGGGGYLVLYANFLNFVLATLRTGTLLFVL